MINFEKHLKTAFDYVKLPMPKWLRAASDMDDTGKLKEFVEWQHSPIVPEESFSSLVRKFKEELIKELGEKALEKIDDIK